MKQLDVQDLLEYGRAATAVLRALQISNSTMTYADFARAIGILEGPNDKWRAWHRQQIDTILNAIAAMKRKAPRGMRLEYQRIVNQRTGRSGSGIAKTSKIVRR